MYRLATIHFVINRQMDRQTTASCCMQQSDSYKN